MSNISDPQNFGVIFCHRVNIRGAKNMYLLKARRCSRTELFE